MNNCKRVTSSFPEKAEKTADLCAVEMCSSGIIKAVKRNHYNLFFAAFTSFGNKGRDQKDSHQHDMQLFSSVVR